MPTEAFEDISVAGRVDRQVAKGRHPARAATVVVPLKVPLLGFGASATVDGGLAIEHGVAVLVEHCDPDPAGVNPTLIVWPGAEASGGLTNATVAGRRIRHGEVARLPRFRKLVAGVGEATPRL